MEKEVLDYIGYMKFYIKTRPQCLMFAMLLKLKFSNAVIMYAPGHHITEIDGQGYDWDGKRDIPIHFTEFPEDYGNSHIVGHYEAIREKFQKELDGKMLELIGSEKARMELALKMAPTKSKAAWMCDMSERSFYRKELDYDLRIA